MPFLNGPARAQDDSPAIRARFMPPDGKILFIIGQDLDAVGGVADHHAGYVDAIDLIPGGVTTYTNVGLDGLTALANWGSGDVSAQLIVDSPVYEHSALVIGFYMANNLEYAVASGSQDAKIDDLGAWIKAQDRPVYLRIGYEFDGEWNRYDPEPYVAAWRRIVDRLRENGVTNVATVWQSATHYSPRYGGHAWIDWYPGDAYVDWFGLSYFEPRPDILNAFVRLAREHGKPVMIAESTPYGADISEVQRADLLWNTWFKPYFEFIYHNSDVIRAVAYINVDWNAQPMWASDHWGDSRVQTNPDILERWLAEMRKDVWLHASPDLFALLSYPAAPAEF